MAPKEESMLKLDNIAFEFGVLDEDVLQYFYLHFGLGGELVLAPDDLEGDELLLLVVEGLEHLAEGPLA